MTRRVLHVVRPCVGARPVWRTATDGGSDAMVALAAQTIARTPDMVHTAVALGDPDSADRCRLLGLAVDATIPTPAGSLGTPERLLARTLAGAGFAHIHAWGTGARAVASGLSSLAPVTHTEALVADDPRARLDPPGAFARPGDLLLPPGGTRAEARAASGLDPDMIVIAVLSDQPGDAEAPGPVVAGGLARVTCGPLTLVFPDHANALDRAALFRRRTGLPWRPLVTPNPMLAAARVADIACVAMPSGLDRIPAGLALAAGACLGAGVPVLAPARAHAAIGDLPPGCRSDARGTAELFKAVYRIASSPERLDTAREETIRVFEPRSDDFTRAVSARWRAVEADRG